MGLDSIYMEKRINVIAILAISNWEPMLVIIKNQKNGKIIWGKEQDKETTLRCHFNVFKYSTSKHLVVGYTAPETGL